MISNLLVVLVADREADPDYKHGIATCLKDWRHAAQVRARGQYSGYHSACRATVLGSFSQGASWETQMCSDGLAPGSSSRVATLNIRYRRSGCSDRMWEPQVAQKRRNLPGDDSYAFRLSSPEIQGNRSRGIPAAEVKAVAWALRQVTQWQWRIGDRCIDFILDRSTQAASSGTHLPAPSSRQPSAGPSGLSLLRPRLRRLR